MKTTCFLILLLILSVSEVYSQNKVVLKGIFIDKKSKDTIPWVNTTSNRLSIQEGFDGFTTSIFFDTIYVFNFSHDYYGISEQRIKIHSTKTDTIEYLIYLDPPKVTTIEGVVLHPKGFPEKLFTSDTLSVADFEIVDDSTYITLLYPKTLEKGSDVACISNQKIKLIASVIEKPTELIHDFRGSVYVMTENHVLKIQCNSLNDTIQFQEIDKKLFLTYIAPIVDSNFVRKYFTDFNPLYPSMNYFVFDELDSAYSKIINVTDELMMELYRSEYKWVDVRTKLWAKEMELNSGIDAEIWVGANYFTRSIYYKQLYAPMFHRNDSIFVFDYYKDREFIFDKFGIKLTEIPITHHYQPKETGWKKQLIQDKKTGEIYAVFEKDGYTSLKRIDVNTGKVIDVKVLKNRYVTKIQVYNNHVFYLYKPFESIQRKTLFKEAF